jgi:hypothetical protein
MKQLEDLLRRCGGKDSDIDRTEPGKALLDIPKLHSKYLNILITTSSVVESRLSLSINKMKKLKVGILYWKT